MALPAWPGGALAQADPAKPARAPTTAGKDQKLEETKTSKVDDFVLGNLAFLTFHELGHALFSEFEMPIAGREEDAADRLAAFFLTPRKDQPDEQFLVNAIKGWFAGADPTRLDRIKWWGAHGTEEQRAYQATCLLYGSDPPRFKSVADAAELPQERRQACPKEATRNTKAWMGLLEPAVRSASPGTAPSPASAKIFYTPSTAFTAERAFLMRFQTLEELRDIMMNDFKFKEGLILSTEECGEANAFWYETDRKLTVCYELVRQYREVALQQSKSLAVPAGKQ